MFVILISISVYIAITWHILRESTVETFENEFGKSLQILIEDQNDNKGSNKEVSQVSSETYVSSSPYSAAKEFTYRYSRDLDLMNKFQTEFPCCGRIGPTDWSNFPERNCPCNSRCAVPKSCCEDVEKATWTQNYNYSNEKDFRTDNVVQIGCASVGVSWFRARIMIIAFFSILLVALQVPSQ